MFWNKYPYTDFHELNLDWVIKSIKELHAEWSEFTILHTIRFYGPWEITKAYPAYSIVNVDNLGYISKQAVPAGIAIDNNDYWELIADYTELFAEMQNRIVEVEKKVSELEADVNTSKPGYYGYFFSPYADKVGYSPQGIAYIGNNVILASYANTTNNMTIFHKIDMNSGQILASSEVMAYHANSITIIDNLAYCANFYTSGTTGNSNILSIINIDTLELVGTLSIDGLNGIRAANYKAGKLYIMDRSLPANYYEYDMETRVLNMLFTFPIKSYQLSYLDKDSNVLLLDAAGTMIYKFSLTGTYLGIIQLDPVSKDLSLCNTEYENLFELEDGTLCISDISWKLAADGRYNRHIISTLGVNKQIKYTQNNSIKLDTSSARLYCSNDYHTFQNGTIDAPYDSIDYAGKMATLYSHFTLIDFQNETIEQILDYSKGNVSIINGTIGALNIDCANVIIDPSVTIDGSCADYMKTYLGLSKLILVNVRRFADLRLAGYINGEGLTDAVGIALGYNSSWSGLQARITNCTTKVLNTSANNGYAGIVPVCEADVPTSCYRREQTQTSVSLVGNDFGMRTVTVGRTCDTVNSSNPVVIENAKLTASPLIAFTFNSYYTFVMDLSMASTLPMAIVVSGSAYVGMLGIQVIQSGNNINVQISANALRKTSDNSLIDLSALTLNKVRIY